LIFGRSFGTFKARRRGGKRKPRTLGKMGIPIAVLVGFLFTVTMGFLFTIALGFSLPFPRGLRPTEDALHWLQNKKSRRA